MYVRRRFLFPILRLIGTRHWLSLSLRYRLITLFASIPPGSAYPFSVRFFGHRYGGDLASHIDWYIYFFGSYERYILLLLRDLALGRSAKTFIDVGANVGQHSIYMSSHVGTVHAFEPFKPVRDTLERNLRLNHLENVMVHPVGLGDKDEELSFYAPDGENLGVGSFSGENGRKDVKEYGSLPVVRGDEYFKQNGIQEADVMKIDVEGYERNVLIGLSSTLREQRPSIVMEFSKETQASFGTKEAFLESLPESYKVLSIRAGKKLFFLFNRDGYVLEDFDFSYVRGNILLIPAEKWGSLCYTRPT